MYIRLDRDIPLVKRYFPHVMFLLIILVIPASPGFAQSLTTNSGSHYSEPIKPVVSTPNPDVADLRSNPSIATEPFIQQSRDTRYKLDPQLLRKSNSPSRDAELTQWSTIKSHFSTLSYPDDAEIAVTKDHKLRMMVELANDADPNTTARDFAGQGIETVKYQANAHTLVVNVPVNLSKQAISTGSPLGIETTLDSIAGITTYEPDFVMRLDYTPDDPELTNQWAIDRLNLTQFWDTQRGNRSVMVAVMDTGIDYTHPDLQETYSPIGFDFVNYDNDPMDGHGHGTHVAGTIAASINNALGVAGVANVTIFAEKILNDQDGWGYYSDAANAIYNATDLGADILSNSWGGTSYSSVLQDAVNYAVSHGALFIAAAGNDASSAPHYPAALDNVISVSAIDQFDDLASFSNFGNTIDIAAPGVDILSTVPYGVYGSYYAYFSGTSMATPHVSAVAALFWSQFPQYSATDIENLLYFSAEDLGVPGYDTSFGNGLIDPVAGLAGLPDYDLSADLQQNGYDLQTHDRQMSAIIRNNGLLSFPGINLEVFSNATLLTQSSIGTLNAGETYVFNFTISHTDPTTVLNITIHVTEHASEPVTANNRDTLYLRQPEILSPDYSTVVQGSLVEMLVDFPAYSSITSVELLRNDMQVASISSISSNQERLFFPVSSNGSQRLQLLVHWEDSTSAAADVDISTEAVTPLADVAPGDYINWVYDYQDGYYQDQNWTFIEWTGSGRINATFEVNYYNSSTVVWEMLLWAEIDIYTGLYLQTNFGWDGGHYSWFTGAGTTLGRSVGDYILPSINWNVLAQIDSLTTLGDLSMVSAMDQFGNPYTVNDITGVLYNTTALLGHLYSTSIVPTTRDVIVHPSQDPRSEIAQLEEYNLTLQVENIGGLMARDLEFVALINDSVVPYTLIFDDGSTLPSGTLFDLRPARSVQVTFRVDTSSLTQWNITVYVDTPGDDDPTNNRQVTLISVVDPSPPTLILQPADLQYTEGETGNIMAWRANDTNPYIYRLFMNGTFLDEGSWVAEVDVTHLADNLSPGIYNFTIYFFDLANSSISQSTLVTVLTNPPPLLETAPGDVNYVEGSTGNQISWNFHEDRPMYYTIYKNGTLLVALDWDGTAITFDIDGLPVGTYNFTIVVEDDLGKSAQDTVLVTVSSSPTTTTSETTSTTSSTSSTTRTTTTTTTSSDDGSSSSSPSPTLPFSFFPALLVLLIMIPIRRRLKK